MGEDGTVRRRRGAMGTAEFVGGGEHDPVHAAKLDALSDGEGRPPSLDDELDPSGHPYRQDDPRLGKGVGQGWGRIVRSVFRIDEEAAFRDLQRVRFERPPSRLEYGELVDALDVCSGNAVLASQLHENAVVVLRLYEVDVEAQRAPMRRKAREELEQKKRADGGKQITEADVVSKMHELWPDEMRRQEENLAKAKGAVKHVGDLHERWKTRAREIDGMVRTKRGA